MREVTLHVACGLDHLEFASAAVRGVALDQLGWNVAPVVEAAVTEVITSLVRRNHGDDPTHAFTITLREMEGGLEVEIRDEGPAFVIEAGATDASVETTDDLSERGFGVAMVHEAMDVVDYRRESGINIIRLVKHRPA
jgi:anti-sigma regulatory factor (Ser/Thr protein kinase)